MSLAKNIRGLYENSHFKSISALEREAGLKQSAIKNILQGKSKSPSINILLAIAEQLNCSVEELMHGYPPVDSNSEEKQERNFNVTLYKKTVDFVKELLGDSLDNVSKDKFTSIVNEVYDYSCEYSNEELDKNFGKWFLSNKGR